MEDFESLSIKPLPLGLVIIHVLYCDNTGSPAKGLAVGLSTVGTVGTAFRRRVERQCVGRASRGQPVQRRGTAFLQ